MRNHSKHQHKMKDCCLSNNTSVAREQWEGTNCIVGILWRLINRTVNTKEKKMMERMRVGGIHCRVNACTVLWKFKIGDVNRASGWFKKTKLSIYFYQCKYSIIIRFIIPGNEKFWIYSWFERVDGIHLINQWAVWYTKSHVEAFVDILYAFYQYGYRHRGDFGQWGDLIRNLGTILVNIL